LKSPSRVGTFFKATALVIGTMLFAIFIAILIATLINYFVRPLTLRELISIGKPTEIQAEFINKVSKNIKVTRDVRLLLGPYTPALGRSRLLRSRRSWLILADEKFFLGLPDIEQKALISYEMSYIIFAPSSRQRMADNQKNADAFAAAYTSPEAMINILNKLVTNPRYKNSERFKLRLKNLEELKKQFLQKH